LIEKHECDFLKIVIIIEKHMYGGQCYGFYCYVSKVIATFAGVFARDKSIPIYEFYVIAGSRSFPETPS
jgi:hypothetical protein